LLTPFARAVFSRDSIAEIIAVRRMIPAQVIQIVNSSCQSGSRYLNTAPSAVAAVSSTRAMKDKGQRDALITKTIRQHINRGHEWNMD
jgi:hypothetical protein